MSRCVEDSGNKPSFQSYKKRLRGCCLWEESDCRSNGQAHLGDFSLLLVCVCVCIDGTSIE